jgi:hypothetical protein
MPNRFPGGTEFDGRLPNALSRQGCYCFQNFAGTPSLDQLSGLDSLRDQTPL